MRRPCNKQTSFQKSGSGEPDFFLHFFSNTIPLLCGCNQPPMKRSFLLVVLLACISVVSGYLMSKASWIGRVGMTLFYREYNLLKIWWQGAIAVFLFFMLLYALHSFLQKKAGAATARFIHFILLLTAAAGLYLTYDDFTTDFSHGLLGRRFHYGFYLVWVGWVLICLFFLFKRKTQKTVITDQDKTGQAIV